MPVPLVMNFHYWGGSPDEGAYEGGFNTVADLETDGGGFIVVHPQVTRS